MLTLTAKPHPLKSQVYTVDLPDETKLVDILPRSRDIVVQYNGLAFPMSEWEKPLSGGNVHVSASTPKGDDILGAVLIVAVAVASAYTGGAVGAAYGAGWGAAAAAGVSVLGSLAASALVQPKSPDAPDNSPAGTVGRALTGSRNRSNPYGVIPRAYGNLVWFPPLAGNPVTESAGDDQYLRMIVCLGYGPLDILGRRVGPGYERIANLPVGDDIRIGETSLDDYEEVTWEIGTVDQLTLYTQDIAEETIGAALDLQDLTTGGGYLDSQDNITVLRRTAVDATEISVDLVWPSGLYALGENGELFNVDVEVKVEYRRVGESLWQTYQNSTVSAKSKNTIRRNWRWGTGKGQYDVQITRVKTTGRARGAVVSDAQWSSLRTIQGDNPAYGSDRHILMALRIKATDQLNGVVDQLSVRTQAVLQVWDGSSLVWQPTNNPAWAYLNSLIGEQVPRPISTDRIELFELQSWATFCDSAGLGYSWVHDAKETMFQRLKVIASTGQGSFSLQDGMYSVVRDNPNEPIVQMITSRNSTNIQSSRRFQKLPHALRVKYVDYRTGSASGVDSETMVYREGYDASNATIFEDFETQGVTNAEEANFQGQYYFRQAILRPETFTCDMDWENLVAMRGNRCTLATDVLKVGLASARIIHIDLPSRTIVLDTEVEYTTERLYGIRVRLPDKRQIVTGVTADVVDYTDQFQLNSDINLLAVGDLVAYGVMDRETIDTKITRIDPGPDFTASLTLVPAAVNIYDFSEDPIYDPVITNPIDPTNAIPPVPVITSVRGDSTAASRNPDGSFRTLLRVSYIFPVQIGVPTLQVETRYRITSEPNWEHAGPFPAVGTLTVERLDEEANYTVQVRSRNRDRVSAWSQAVGVDISGQAVVPPTSVDVEVGTFSVTLRPRSIFVNSQYEYFRSEVELAPTDVEANAVNLGTGPMMVASNLRAGTLYWFYIRMYTVNSVSGFYILSVTTREDFEEIFAAFDEEIRAPGGIVDQFQNDINNLGNTIDEVALEVNGAYEAAVSARTDAENALEAARNSEALVGALDESVTQFKTEFDGRTATLEQEFSTLSNEQLALSQAVTSMGTAVEDNSAEITSTQQAISLDKVAQALTNSVIQAKNSLGQAIVDVENIVRVDEERALAQHITTVDAAFQDSAATIGQELTALVNEQQALAQDLTSLNTDYQGNKSSVSSSLISLSNAQSATAGRLDTFEVNVGQNFASVEQDISAVYDPSTGAVARAVTTVNANGRQGVLGIQVNGRNSEIIGIADQFAILNQVSGELVTAFIVADGRVVIPDALIRDASITNAKIQNGAINNAKIENGAINNAKIANASINTAKIENGAITTAKIGSAQVGTLEVAGQAITVEADATTNGGMVIAVANGWVNIQTLLVVGNSVGAPVSILGIAFFEMSWSLPEGTNLQQRIRARIVDNTNGNAALTPEFTVAYSDTTNSYRVAAPLIIVARLSSNYSNRQISLQVNVEKTGGANLTANAVISGRTLKQTTTKR